MEPSAPQGAKGAAAGEQDLSMEEILQSIKKIIAEDGEEAKPDAPKQAKEKEEEDVPGSDVLELTEVVPDDDSTESINAAEEKKPAAEAAKTKEKPVENPADVLSQIDQALTSAESTAKPAHAPAAEEKPAAASPPVPAVKSMSPSDPMLSDQATAKVASSMEKLKSATEPPPVVTTPSPTFHSGSSVEDMVAVMLRPMIKEWLDKNLPAIVERIVEREVKRLTK